VYQAFTDPDQLAQWYGPNGFPVPRDTVEIDARVGGAMRFTMVSEADPSLRSGVNAQFTEVVENAVLACAQEWDGVPGQAGTWSNDLRVEFYDDEAKTRLVLREGPHPPGTADFGRQAWQMMFAKLDAFLNG